MSSAVVDASTLISLSESCLFNLFNHLKVKNGLEFLISKSVFNESVTKPLKINRFKLSALRVKQGVDIGAIQVVERDVELGKIVSEIERLSEEVLVSEQRPIKVIHRGEIDALALAKYSNARTLVIDEKVTRLLLEDVMILRKLIERRQHVKVSLNKQKYGELKSFLGELNVIRSSELIALAYEQGLLEKELGGKKSALEAALYSVKFKGCSLSEFEIREFLKQVK